MPISFLTYYQKGNQFMKRRITAIVLSLVIFITAAVVPAQAVTKDDASLRDSGVPEDATPTYTTEKDVTWSVDDTNVATIDENGVLTPVKNGTVTITCTSKENNDATNSITIEVTGGNIPLDEGGISQGGAE